MKNLYKIIYNYSILDSKFYRCCKYYFIIYINITKYVKSKSYMGHV